MIPLKNNEASALSFGADFSSDESGLGKISITYAGETTLTGVAAGKSAASTAKSAISGYKSSLQSDAKNISTLGKGLSKLDLDISKTMG